MHEHGGSQVSNEGESLGMQISEHGIRFPAADEADGVGIDLATKKCHGPSGAQAAGIDVRGSEAEARAGLG